MNECIAAIRRPPYGANGSFGNPGPLLAHTALAPLRGAVVAAAQPGACNLDCLRGFSQSNRMPGFWTVFSDLWRPIEPPQTATPEDAESRSLELLRNNLSPAQRQQFALYNYFDVTGGDSGKRYCIHMGRAFNIAQLDANGARERTLCFEPQGTLPIGDVLLAQKIALELFELQALRIANISPSWLVGHGGAWPLRARRSYLPY